jgi:hypothetical protein
MEETMKIKSLHALLGAALLLAPLLRAEESGTGHYMPGATASFIDAFPGRTALAVVPTYLYYSGGASASRAIPIIGGTALNLDATVHAVNVPLIYQTPLGLLGGHYAFGAVLPYAWVETTGRLTIGNQTGQRRDTANGLGDIALLPFMLGWTRGDLKYDARLFVYTPTGDYDKNDLANLGKNYWTFEPVVSLSYLSSKIGLEVSAFAGVDFNTRNSATDYQTGHQLHFDVTVAQHLPLGKLGVFGLGANAFYYQQITGDSGSGAILGDFEGRTVGVGPVLSYVTKVGKTDLIAEVKWLPELNVEHRLKGDYIWFKLALVF